MSLFFAKIHWGNFLYAYARSLVCPVQHASATVANRWLKRFRPIHFEEAFTYDEWVRLRDETWSEWAAIEAIIPPTGWRRDLFGRTVDFRRIAMQHLCKEYLAHRRLVRYIERLGGEDAWLADSMALRYIRSMGKVHGLDVDGKVRLARGAWLWDLVYLWGRNLGWAAYLVVQAWSALRSGQCSAGADLLHEGLAVSESGSGPHELSFAWIEERGLCPPDRIIYVLAGRPRRWSPNVLQRYALLRGLGWETVFRALGHGARFLLLGILRAGKVQKVLLTEFCLRSVAPYLNAERRKVRTYLTTISACSPEHPSVALYNAMGVRTILWAYGANTALFNQRYLSPERHFHSAHMETAECWLWSEHHLSLWRSGEILPSRIRYRLIGPAMMADASPCLVGRAESRRRFLGIDDTGSTARRTVAVFDLNPVNKEGQKVLQLGPLPITEEFVEAFYQQLLRLLEALPDIRLLVKTKRQDHPHRLKPPAQKRLVDPSNEWVRTGRVINLAPDTNPYIPIGAADLTIGVPFTSPVLAGLHFGRPGLFHDPLGTALRHHYHALDAIVSHGYGDLEKKVRYWLYDCTPEAFQTFLDRPETQRFLGPHPGVDPAEEFGKALWGESFTLPPATGGMSHARDNDGNRVPADSRTCTSSAR